MFDWNEYERWIRSALATFESAKRDNDFNWACFKAEQAAQLAVKAYLILVGKSYFGHDLITLLRNTGLQLDKEILQCANFLTKVYIPSRYPDALPEGVSPYEVYDEEDKQKAIECASKIINLVKEAGENLRRKEKGEGKSNQ